MQRTKVHTSCMADIPFGRRNRLHNGDFRVDQINAGSAVTPAATAYVADNCLVSLSQPSKLTFQRILGSANLPCPASERVTVASAYAVSSADYFSIDRAIEGVDFADMLWGTANAKPITVSFQIYVSIAGTYSFSIRNHSATYSYVFTKALIVGINTVTAVIPGCTTGAWPTGNSRSMVLSFDLGSGSNLRTSTANSWVSGNFVGATGSAPLVATLGAVYEISNVQIEAGSVATPFEFLQYQEALAWCQRYFCTSYSAGTVPGAAGSIPGIFGYAINVYDMYSGQMFFPVSMRTIPTVTLYSTVTGTSGTLRNSTSSSDTAACAAYQSTAGFRVLFQTGAGVSNNLYLGNYVADARM